MNDYFSLFLCVYISPFYKQYPEISSKNIIEEKKAWFNPGWQPQAQLGDGKAPKAV